jgi:hypothetical protein
VDQTNQSLGDEAPMRTRGRIALGVVVAAALACIGVAVYRDQTAGYAEVQEITERMAAAMVAGDCVTLAAESVLEGRPDTVDWLVAKGPYLSRGYWITVHRNGHSGHLLLDVDQVSHIGIIWNPNGNITLGFWRDPKEGRLTFVTSAAELKPLASGARGGRINLQGDSPNK